MQCSTTVVSSIRVRGPVPLRLVTLGVDLRIGLQILGLLVFRSVEGNTLTSLANTVVVLDKTLLNRPLAMTALNRPG